MWGVAVLALPALLVLLVLGHGAGENGGAVSLMGGELREIDRFRRAQARLERASGAGGGGPRLGVKAMVAHNMAEGDGLEAEMMERRSAGRRLAAPFRCLAPRSFPPLLLLLAANRNDGGMLRPVMGGGVGTVVRGEREEKYYRVECPLITHRRCGR